MPSLSYIAAAAVAAFAVGSDVSTRVRRPGEFFSFQFGQEDG